LVIFLAIGLGLTMLQPFKYGAESNALVVLSNPNGADPYSIDRSNQYLGNVLAKVIVSGSFYEEVMNSGFNIERSYFSEDSNAMKEIKEWNKTVGAKSLLDSGIIQINVSHPDKYQTEQIARAINYVLITKHQAYDGTGNNVAIKIIDKPVVSSLPVSPNIFLNLSFSLLLGLLTAVAYIYLFPERKYDLRLWPKKFGFGGRSGKSYENINYTDPAKDNNWHSVSAILKEREQASPHRTVINENGGNEFSNEVKREAGSLPIQDESFNGKDKISYEDIIGQGSMENLVK